MAIPPQEVSVERALMTWPEPESTDDGNPPVDAVLGAAPLRIAQIELVGFKSFRDRTVLRFQPGVTGVVGPNGCGKSNLVDAIRWVLGEQSAKRLRGEGMEDVIFGGNERQAPVGMAQVSIVFETDGLPLDQFALLKETGHPITTAGPSEIMVTRRYLRSGESEYLMNGIPCRLRDITELFLGTGVGTKAYAIIEQGRVEQLVGAKPEELRLFIEEAAGTTLYRSRRQVAERKMERTQDNLQRVRDVLNEVDRQLAGLRRQAKRAEQYRTLQAEIETLDLALASRRHARMSAELRELGDERQAATTRQGALGSELESAEGTRRASRESEAQMQRRAQQVQAAAFEARTARDTCRHELARLEARAVELSEQETTTAQDHARALEECARMASECSGAERTAVALSAAIADAETGLREQEQAFDVATGALAEVERELEDAKVALVDALAAEARAKNTRTALETRRTEEDARAQRLHAQAAALKVREGEALTRATAGEKTVLDLQARLELLEGTKRVRAQELRRLLEERANWDGTLDGMKEGLARVRSRRDSLRELEDSHAGYAEGVRAVLASSSRDDALGLVAEILEVPAVHERALAAALGEQLQAVVMRDQEVASEAVKALRRAGAGRATCIPRAARVPADAPCPPGVERLLDLVHARPGHAEVAAALLGHVLLARDLETALAVWRTTSGAWTIVTPAGETVDANGAVTGGSHRAEETLLAERRERRALDVEIESRERDVASARKRQQDLAAAVEGHEAGVRELDAELAKVTVAVVGGEKDVERVRLEMRDLAEQAAAIAAELETVQARLESMAAEGATLDQELALSATRRAELERAAGAAEATRLERLRAVGTLQDTLTERRIALAEERARRTTLEEMIDRLRRTDAEARQRAAAVEARRESDALTLTRTRADAADAANRLVALEAEVEARGAAVGAAEVEGAAARAAAEAAERTIADLQAQLEAVRGRLAALNVQAAERRSDLEHLEQTIRERYQRELAGDAAVQVDDDDSAAQEERLTHLRQRIGTMGDVNVAALSEVAELEERQKFLDAQRADLERALEDLRKTIARLNRTSRTRFRETFERVDATFREVFPKLFQGGKAQLRLTEEEHLLDSGVEIVVQPPGKRVGPLDLLSGGEKALTAVSLIFALFLTKPSPFCFLDEVDAPLDDANIGRFNAMVREMSTRSQFILITHNKRTMEVAETLYGITMEEPGVSKVVSVRLPE